MRQTFAGRIAGLGSTSGVRVVVGRWERSPFGAFADVMLADASGRRWLLAPTPEVAEFVSATYHFDEVVVVPVSVEGDRVWEVVAGELTVRLRIGARMPLGWLLRLVPRPLATSVGWSRLTDPVARLVLRGVRTRGMARPGRLEVYGASDLHRVVAGGGSWRGESLGELASVLPEPGFGFGSTPPEPSVTTLVTTVVDR